MLMIIHDSHGFILWNEKLKFFVCFHKFQNLIENQFDWKIKVFQCDNGRELNSSIFLVDLHNNGIELYVSYPRTLEQNEMTEQKH